MHSKPEAIFNNVYVDLASEYSLYAVENKD